MKNIIFLFLLIPTINSLASESDTLYLNNNFKVSSANEAEIRIITSQKKDKISVDFQKMVKGKWTGTKKSQQQKYKKTSDSSYVRLGLTKDVEEKYKRIAPKHIIITKTEYNNSYVKTFSSDNSLISEGYYSNVIAGIKEGIHKVYYPNGKIMLIQEFDNNMLVHAESFLIDGEKGMSDVHVSVSELPLFNTKPFHNFELGFWEYTSNTTTINMSNQHYLDGLCIISFVITAKGELKDFQIIQPAPDNGINYIARKFVLDNKNNWSPATLSGEPVNYLYKWYLDYGQIR